MKANTETKPAKKNKYNNPSVGCYIDESSGSADALNLRTIEFAADYGFAVPPRFDRQRFLAACGF